MKKKLLLLIFVISFSAQGQTSVYHPFPDSNAVWIVSSNCGTGFGICNLMTRYEQTGDTIINSKTYHTISMMGFSWSCTFGSPGPCIFPSSTGFIREDTTKRIWLFDTSTMTDTLLYDFNLNVGDTIRTMLGSMPWGAIYIVQSIDSIWVGNSYRSRYNYSSSEGGPDACTHFLIEGIGGGGGIFSELCGGFCFEHGYMLMCFKQNNQTLYYPNNTFCQVDTAVTCNFTVSVSVQESENYFSIFPSPTTNEFKVQSSKLEIESVEVYNVMGGKQIALPLNPLKGTSASIDVSGLSPGIYFVRVRTEKGSVIKKLIKQ